MSSALSRALSVWCHFASTRSPTQSGTARLYVTPGRVLIGLTVRMGHLLANYPSHAKRLAAYCMAGTMLVGLLVASCLNVYH
jgi:hypothetical protein